MREFRESGGNPDFCFELIGGEDFTHCLKEKNLCIKCSSSDTLSFNCLSWVGVRS